MQRDQHGNTVSGGTAEAVGLFDDAINEFNVYRGDPIALLDQAVCIAPDFAMPYIARAHIFAASSEPAAIDEVGLLVNKLRELQLNDRERSHLAALELLSRREWSRAAQALDQHNLRYPRDMIALQSGHLIDFLRANARNLRDRIARVLPYWSADLPGYPVLLGMHAFGLEECGDYAYAEEQGRQAVALQPYDCWAHHAVTHVMEMQGRAEDGIGWMSTREPYWAGDDNGFKVHNWWHRALFHLDLGESEKALALYDGPVRIDRSALALDLVDASSLLWRLSLSGIDAGERWQELADAWQAHADGKTYPFNDWHAVMAYLGAGRDGQVADLKNKLRDSAKDDNESARWCRDWGLPLIDGFVAFWNEDYRSATEHLFSARQIANAFGGSHAQRDIIDWTLTEAAIRGGHEELAAGLANERLAHKPHSHINTEFFRRAMQAADKSAQPLRHAGVH